MTAPLPPYDEVIAHKKKLVAQLQVMTPLASLRALASMQARPRDVRSVLRENRVALVARVMNPGSGADQGQSAGPYDPVALARRLVAHGAQALMVLTDERYYQGGIEHLTLVASAVDVPVIRQDFVLDEYQVVETRAAGADGLLLIASMLDADRLRSLISATQRNLMTEVVQVRNEDDLRMALPFEPRVIAISNRDPHTGALDLATTCRLVPLIPRHITTVSMGGLGTPQDVASVLAGVDGVLVDEELLCDPQAGAAVASMLSRPF